MGFKLTLNCGSEEYKAPELLEKKSYEGKQVDLFALGKILFVMLAGTPPFAEARK